MKKIALILACLSIFSVSLFAQSSDSEYFSEDEKYDLEKVKTVIVIPDEQHCTDRNASVKIEYSPMYDEVRIYYETLYVTYDRGEAMNTVLACLQDFQKNYKYYSYRYLKDDKERFFKDDRGQRKAQYFSYLKFSR